MGTGRAPAIASATYLYHFAFSFDLAELTFDRTFPAIIYFAILFDLDTEDLSFAVPSTSLGQCCQTDFISCGSVGLVDRIGLAFVVYTFVRRPYWGILEVVVDC